MDPMSEERSRENVADDAARPVAILGIVIVRFGNGSTP
jgi:hypothetical protein